MYEIYPALLNALPDMVAVHEIVDAQIAAIGELCEARKKRDDAQLARDFAENTLLAKGVEGKNKEQRDAVVANDLFLFDSQIAAAQEKINELQARLEAFKAALRSVDMHHRDMDQELKLRELEQRKIESDLRARSLTIRERELSQHTSVDMGVPVPIISSPYMPDEAPEINSELTPLLEKLRKKRDTKIKGSDEF